MLGGIIEDLCKGDIQSFEEFYILTYETLYSYAWILTEAEKEKANELLIRTYCYVYDNRNNIATEDNIYAWLYHQMDEAAQSYFNMTEEMIEEIRQQEEDCQAAITLSEGTAASILLIIEERLELLEEHEEIWSKQRKLLTGFKLAFACALFIGTLWLLSLGLGQLTEQMSFLKAPFVETLPEKIIMAGTEEDGNHKCIKIGDRLVYLSDIGQVLYFLPLQESDWEDKIPYNPELQETGGWLYYLPCPERENSQLSEVPSQLAHALYRMEKMDGNWELVTREVDDYAVFEGHIYVEQYGRIRVLEEQGTYEPLTDPNLSETVENTD